MNYKINKIVSEFGNLSRIFEAKSSLFPPWTTDLKIGSTPILHTFCFPPLPLQAFPLEQMKIYSAPNSFCFRTQCYNFFTLTLKDYLT